MQPHYNHYIYEDLTSNRFEYEEAKSAFFSHKTSAHLTSYDEAKSAVYPSHKTSAHATSSVSHALQTRRNPVLTANASISDHTANKTRNNSNPISEVKDTRK